MLLLARVYNMPIISNIIAVMVEDGPYILREAKVRRAFLHTW